MTDTDYIPPRSLSPGQPARDRAHRGRLFVRRFGVTLIGTALIAMCGLAGCNSKSPVVAHRGLPWLLLWQPPPGGIDPSETPEAAFAAGMHVFHTNDSTEHQPALTAWLATGPEYGLALVQIDPAGQYVDAAGVGVDTTQHTWVGGAGTLRTGNPCVNGVVVDGPLTFPEPACGSGISMVMPYSGRSYYYTQTSWHSNDAVYVLQHLVGDLVRPAAGATSVTMGGRSGWLTETGGVTAVTLALRDREWLIAGCTWPRATCEALAAQSLEPGTGV